MDNESEYIYYETDISGVLATLLYVSRIAGLAPLHFRKRMEGWRVQLSFGWSAYGYILITITYILTIALFVNEAIEETLYSMWMQANTRKVISFIQIFLMLFSAGASVFTSPQQMRSLINILGQVQKINYDLNVCHWPAAWGCTMSSLMIAQVLLCIIVSSAEMVLRANAINNRSSLLLSVMASCPFYFICYWIFQIRNLQFIATVLHVKHSFKVLNNRLENILMSLDGDEYLQKKFTEINNYVAAIDNTKNNLGYKTSAIVQCKPDTASGSVRRLALTFACLCDTVRAVDRCHGFIVMLMLASFLLHLIFTPCFLVTDLVDPAGNVTQIHDAQWLYLLVLLFWCIFHTYNLVMTIEPCDSTHLEMERTRELVGQLMQCSNSMLSSPLVVELDQFFDYLLLNDVRYRPLKIITMTRSLVVTILGSIATYVVIILQL